MKKLVVLLFFSLIGLSAAWSQTDSIVIKPAKGLQCAWNVTVKNRNAARTSIDEIRFEITTANGSIWFPPTAPTQWGGEILPGDLIVSFTAQVNLLTWNTDKSGFVLDMFVEAEDFDKPVNVKWTTLNGTQTVSTGNLTFICTPFQYGDIDTVTVVSSISNNNPCFDFTVFNKNANVYPVSRLVFQLTNPTSGTIRPSRVTAPSGWELDSVNALSAYFSTSTDPIQFGDNLGGFDVCLRGNTAVNKFTFNWFSYEEGNALLGRDTLRDISVPGSFTAVAESDSLTAAVVDGCLYELTVKNYHVANGLLPSRIRKVVLWTKTAGVSFTAAPSAPPNWSKVIKADSIIYTASADSTALPSGIISNLFRFSVDPPSSSPFTLGWRTFRDLTNGLSTGDLQLQCNEQPPLDDMAALEVIDVCNWNIRITNQHNTPASDLYGIELSIPAGSGTLTTFASSLGWTKSNETPTSVRYLAPSGSQQSSNTQQSILFAIDPQTPGAPIVLTWKTFDETGLQSNTPLKADTFQVSCSPIVNLCDETRATIGNGDTTCTQNFTIHSRRSDALTTVTIEPRDGWNIDTTFAPAGWDMQVDANKTLVTYTNATGIAPDETLNGFIIRFAAINQSDTFHVKVTTVDVSSRSCDTTLEFICKSQLASVSSPVFVASQVSVVPNPVERDATIELVVSDQGRVRISLLDILGREVRAVANSFLQPGAYKMPLQMNSLDAGTYYLRVQTPYGVVTKKIVLAN